MGMERHPIWMMAMAVGGVFFYPISASAYHEPFCIKMNIQSRVTALFSSWRNASGEVGLVWLLVFGKARIPVDSKDAMLGLQFGKFRFSLCTSLDHICYEHLERLAHF